MCRTVLLLIILATSICTTAYSQCSYGSFTTTPAVGWMSNGNLDGFTTISENTQNNSGGKLYSDGANVIYASAAGFQGGDTIIIRGNYQADSRRGPLVLTSVGSTALNSGPVMDNSFPANNWADISYTIPAGTPAFSQLMITGTTNNGVYVSIDVVSVTRTVCYTCDINISPVLSATTISNTCPVKTYNLNSITASNTPAGAELTWHTGTPATDTNRIANPGAANGHHFHAAFRSIANKCYSGENGIATTIINTDGDSDCDGTANSTDLDDDNDGVPDKQEQICDDAGYNTNSHNEINNIFTKYGIVSGNTLFDQLADDIGLIFSVNNSFTTGVFMASACNEPAIYGAGWSSDMWFKSVNPSDITKAIPLQSITFKADCAASNEYLTYSAYGKDGNFLYTYNIAANQPHNSNQVFDLVMNPAYEVYSISVTRSANAAVVVGVQLKEGFGVTLCDKDIDTDNDGIPNSLDLDSDNDGCPDLKEANVSPATDVFTPASSDARSFGIAPADLAGSQLNPAAADTNNDGLNDSIDPDKDGQVNYTSTYKPYALTSGWSYCADTDNDGIPDLSDLDDDNDGILDAVESPSCFYTQTNATSIASVSSELSQYSTHTITNAYDGNSSTESAFTAGQDWAGKTVFEIRPAIPVALSAVNFDIGTWYLSNGATSTFQLEGWNGTAWVQLSVPMANTSTTDFSISNTMHTGTVYSRYRIAGVTGTCYYSGVKEITLTAYQYQASANPKPSCSNDTDADGILNHQDLDSDGDGCSDASETGITGTLLPGYMINNTGLVYSAAAIAQGPYGSNGFANPLETSTSPESGVYSGSYTNYSNATNSAMHSCIAMPLVKPDVNATYVTIAVNGNLSTNDSIPSGTTYGSATALAGYSNPGPATPTITGSTGAYTFTSSIPGVYKFLVPVCPPSVSTNCPVSLLTIKVLESVTETNKPFTAPDFAITKINKPVTLKTITNDRSANNNSGSLQPSTLTITSSPKHGTAVINSTTGDITYTPKTGFTGTDTLAYNVCDNASPMPNCASDQQIITVLPAAAANSVIASDDYLFVPAGTTGTGNVLNNDYDTETHTLTATPQSRTIAGIGTFTLAGNGTYTFTPGGSYSGPVNFPYEVCDNASPAACAKATLYLLVPASSALPLNLLTFTAAKENNASAGLRWTTANEINTSHFVIERMLNGTGQWQAIGTVNTTGNGNTSVNHYYFRDVQPAAGANYYRLKQVDQDGRYKYSAVRLATFGASASIFVYPNPSEDYVFITGNNILSGQVQVYDALGQELNHMIKTGPISPQQIKLDLTMLTPGIYIIKVNGQAIKLVKK